MMMLPAPFSTEPAVKKDATEDNDDERATATATPSPVDTKLLPTISGKRGSRQLTVNTSSSSLSIVEDKNKKRGDRVKISSRNGSTSQLSGSKSSGSNERQRKKEAVVKTATQKSVLRSKMVFFMFLLTVAAVAGGKGCGWICMYLWRLDLSLTMYFYFAFLFDSFIIHLTPKNGRVFC